MSEEQTHGVPAETQRSGFGGERRDGGADELSPKGEANERSAGAPTKPVPGFVGKGDPRERDEGCPDGRPESERTLGRRVSRETEKPPKNRKASVYLYLLVLFGAAFLMLLLAYFVQQRNNEATISGLQNSWDLSREELVEENQKLTEKNEELEIRLAVMEDQRDRANRQIDELERANANYEALADGYDKYVGYTSILQSLYAGEAKLAEGDYAGAAAALADIDYDYFIRTIGDYDAEMEHYNPEEIFLRPRFDALVSALTEQGALDESWAG